MATTMEAAQRARQGLLIYLLALLVLSAIFESLIMATREPIAKHLGLVFTLMWAPGISSFVARLALRENLKDVSFSFDWQGAGKTIILAWVYPLFLGSIAYGATWVTGLTTFSPPMLDAMGIHNASPILRWIVLLAVAMSLGSIYGLLWAAGEQIGWRGYLLTRLMDAGVPQPVLVSGLIWAVWQIPLVLSGQYASSGHPRLSALLFIVNIVAFGYVTARLRLQSGSVWPAVLVHSSWNAVIQGVFDASTQNAGIWVGESGAVVALCNVAITAVLVRGNWPVRRTPAEISPHEYWQNGALRHRA
jgi:membrane protease YdiL (CAAX protease family)